MRQLFIARFRGARGRYLVQETGGGYEGQKILDARQERYGHKPDPQTGLYLHECRRMFSMREVLSLKAFTPPRSAKEKG